MTSGVVRKYSIFNESFGKYYAIFAINIKSSMAYFGALFIGFVSSFAKLLTYSLIYKAAFEAFGPDKFPDLTLAQVIWLVVFTQSIYISRDTMHEISASVKSGQIAVFLNKPFSYPLFHYFSYLGKTIVPTVTDLAFGSVIAYFLVGPVPIDIFNVFAVLPLALGALTLIFFQSFIFGLISFWIEDPDSVSRIYHKFDMVLGGRIIPIILFPEPLRTIALYLPWAQQFYSVGKNLIIPDHSEIIRFYLLQGFWVIFFGLVSIWLFRKGVKNIATNGG